MKVVLVNGSPHKSGCTHVALQEVASALEADGIETQEIWLGAKPISGCLACGRCRELGKCVIDDIANKVAAAIDGADGVVLGSPVHYAAPSGQIVSCMHRVFYCGAAHPRGKVGAAVVSCRRGGAATAFDQLNKYFSIAQMPIATSQYWNQIHGNTPEEARQDLEGLQTMRTLGHNIAWMLRCRQQAEDAGVAMPEPEPKVATNFIR